jgi:putative DNA methylase
MSAPTLIERWFPAASIGAESLRERGASSALPPINFLHVWWARRPLTSSRAAVVASLLPAWPSSEEAAVDDDTAGTLRLLAKEFPGGESEYRAWFLRTLGIFGDPVEGRRQIAAAKLSGVQLEGNGYGYKRAFSASPSPEDVDRIHRLASASRRAYSRTVLDPFAGGGSIPFEAARYGCDTIANELNPVASAVLAGTVTLPIEFGDRLPSLISEYGGRWTDRIRSQLAAYFPLQADETAIVGYVWAHAIPCPETGYATPLIPNSWLANTDAKHVALEITGDPATGGINRRLITGAESAVIGPTGTYKGGKATSIFTGQVIEGDVIKQSAKDGLLSEILLAVVHTKAGVRGRLYRLPTEEDLRAVDAATQELEREETKLELNDLLPTEAIDFGKETKRSHDMGISTWRAMFTPRQRLSHAIALRTLHEVVAEARRTEGDHLARPIALYLALQLDKSCDYNSRLSSWDPTRDKIRNTFDRHDFAFKHTFAEFDAAHSLYQWTLSQVHDATLGIVRLIGSSSQQAMDGRSDVHGACRVLRGSAAGLGQVETGSVDALVTDPPYYDNVIYSECSDYFYVWLKRALRDTWPEFCDLELTEKQGEAVANPALYANVATHAGHGKRKPGTKTAAELADQHYERMLGSAWREAHRVLRDDGVMTVMFTHKRVDAWDTLGASLLNAGFSIDASWPVHTESEHSLHQAKKNSASSTIFLACRKRGFTEPAFFSDLRDEITHTARDAAKRFAADGLTGIDLTLATYGPVLGVLSQRWPVYTGQLDSNGERQVIRPDQALTLAYEEVARLKKRALLGGKDTVFDPYTDWYLTAWNDFRAAEFPSGEALKLSLATHIDLDDVDKGRRLIATKAGWATLQTPAERVTAGKLDPDQDDFPTQVDRLHALMYIYQHDGLQTARTWLARRGWSDDRILSDLLQAAGNAIPRIKMATGWLREESRVIDDLAATLFPDVTFAPAETGVPAQQTLDLV